MSLSTEVTGYHLLTLKDRVRNSQFVKVGFPWYEYLEELILIDPLIGQAMQIFYDD